ncbi:MAG: Maf family protein [Bacteroidales bacterium]|nr:Maf family protein [Bacteroidales bacterium]
MKKMRVVLSSHSPRRRELLAALDVPFTVEVGPDSPERYDDSLPHRGIPEFLSRSKSLAFHRPLADDEVLLTADTLVMLPGAGTDLLERAEILGKPADRDEAFAMLRALSGRTHYVLTGVTLRTNREIRSFSDVTEVDVAALGDSEIAYYVDRYRPYDKAGAYGVQEWFGHACISGIRGSYFNVMGLPVQRVYEALKEIGL